MRLRAGQVAVVTGAASGIGLAMARRFAADGLKVVLADVEEGALEKAASGLRQDGADVHARVVDVGERADVVALAEDVYGRYGAVHVLCNNAGVGSGAEGRMWEHDPNDWKWAFAVNVWGVFHGIQAFVPRMIAAWRAGSRRQHLVRRRRDRPAAHGLRLRRHQGRRRDDDRVPLRASEGGARARGGVRALPRAAHAPYRAVGVAPQPAVAVREAAAAQDPYRGLDQWEAAMREAGREVRFTPVEEVADLVAEGIGADRFWLLPESEHSDRQIRARARSMLDRADPSYLERFILD